jgi:DNA-binding transcriptional regulator YdaS (Cro superfamily)
MHMPKPSSEVTLREYLDGLPRGGMAIFAKEIGVSPVYLSQLASGQDGREPSPELCVVIENKSECRVTRRTLRADWKKIWPELERRSMARA